MICPASRPCNCSLGANDMWWLKWPSPCPQPCLAPEPEFLSVLGSKLLWRPIKALPFTMNNSWSHVCPHMNLDSISQYVIGSNFSYFLFFFPKIWKHFWGILPQSPLQTWAPWPPFPTQPVLSCQMHGLHGNFWDLPLILWSQKKRNPASNFTMLWERLQALIKEKCPWERSGRARRTPQAVTIPPVAPLLAPTHHPSLTHWREGRVYGPICLRIHP